MCPHRGDIGTARHDANVARQARSNRNGSNRLRNSRYRKVFDHLGKVAKLRNLGHPVKLLKAENTGSFMKKAVNIGKKSLNFIKDMVESPYFGMLLKGIEAGAVLLDEPDHIYTRVDALINKCDFELTKVKELHTGDPNIDTPWNEGIDKLRKALEDMRAMPSTVVYPPVQWVSPSSIVVPGDPNTTWKRIIDNKGKIPTILRSTGDIPFRLDSKDSDSEDWFNDFVYIYKWGQKNPVPVILDDKFEKPMSIKDKLIALVSTNINENEKATIYQILSMKHEQDMRDYVLNYSTIHSTPFNEALNRIFDSKEDDSRSWATCIQ